MSDPRELPFVVESLGVEQRVLFREGDSWCRATTIDLRSGIRLGVTTCRFEPSFSFLAEQPETFVRRRHLELQRQGLANEAIFARLEQELARRRFAAPAYTRRQLRRIVYG